MKLTNNNIKKLAKQLIANELVYSVSVDRLVNIITQLGMSVIDKTSINEIECEQLREAIACHLCLSTYIN